MRRARRAHPRSRGENAYVTGPDNLCSGSSPLTRGKPVVCACGFGVGRLIPAHAGKTSSLAASAGAVRAHPRSRGENPHARMTPLQASGSSPLTRGKPRPSVHHASSGRLIPAHAGKTPRRWLSTPWRAAHPRSRGENSHRMGGTEFPEGSSPLTRGKRGGQAIIGPPPRLIPAHAGKTGSSLRW